jgi:MFS transporter, CP family, cyanate transporter
MRDERPGGRWLLLIALVVVGLNLRGPIVAVSPVLEDIRADLAIAPTSAGLLTTIPVMCFAALSQIKPAGEYANASFSSSPKPSG